MANSSAVSDGDNLVIDQYNDLRDDVLDNSTGHTHTGSANAGKVVLHSNVTLSGTDEHHPKSHVHTGDGSGTVAHSSTSGRTANDHHAQLHEATHDRGAADEIDGDVIDITFNPTNYVPDVTPSEVTHADELSAHLKGIDNLIRDKSYNVGSFVVASADTARSEAGDAYVKVKEIQVFMGGTITCTWDQLSTVNGQNVKARVYIGGVATGAEKNVFLTSYATQTDNITVSAGDLVQLYIHGITSGSSTCSIRNFRINVSSHYSPTVVTD